MCLRMQHGVRRAVLVVLSALIAIALGVGGPTWSAPEEDGESWAYVTLLRAGFPKTEQGAIVSTQRVRVEVKNAPALSPEGLKKWAITDRLWNAATSAPILGGGGLEGDQLDPSLSPDRYRIAVNGGLQAGLRLTVGVFGQEREVEIDEILIAPPDESAGLDLRDKGVEPDESTELYKLYKLITVTSPQNRPNPETINWTKIGASTVDDLAAYLKYEGTLVPDHFDLILSRPLYPDRVYTLSLGDQQVVFGGQRTGLAALSETAQLRAAVKDGGEYELTLTSTPNYGSWGKFDYYANFAAEAHIDSPDEPENRDWVKATYDYAFVSDDARRQAGLRLGIESDSNLSEVRPMVDGYLAGILVPGAIGFLTGQAGWDHTDEEVIYRGLLSAEYVGLAGPGTLRIRVMGGYDRQADWVHFQSVEWWAPFDEKRDLYLDFVNGYDLPDFERIDRRVKIGLRQNF